MPLSAFMAIVPVVTQQYSTVACMIAHLRSGKPCMLDMQNGTSLLSQAQALRSRQVGNAMPSSGLQSAAGQHWLTHAECKCSCIQLLHTCQDCVMSTSRFVLILTIAMHTMAAMPTPQQQPAKTGSLFWSDSTLADTYIFCAVTTHAMTPQIPPSRVPTQAPRAVQPPQNSTKATGRTAPPTNTLSTVPMKL